MNATPEQKRAVFDMVTAIADCIRDLGTVPSGHLYARVMGHVDLRTYETVIQILKNAKLVEEKSHELRWIGGDIR